MEAAGSPEQAKKKSHKCLSQKQVIKYNALEGINTLAGLSVLPQCTW